MTFDAGLTLAVVLVTLVLLAMEWMSPDLLLLAALGVLTAAGVVDLQYALLGFADPTLLAIGSLFVVAAGLRSTGVLRKAAHLLFGHFESLRPVLVRLGVATSVSSSFLNNTPIVAMGIPAVLSWTRGRRISPSHLLIPLSYASILGGLCTLIGTSTNLVADGLLRSAGLEGLGFFELSVVGVPMAVAGIAYLALATPLLLPERGELGHQEYGTGGIHVTEVPEASTAIGRTLAEAGLGVPELQVVRIIRADGTLAQVSPETVVRAGDEVTFQGGAPAMASTASRLGLVRVALPAADRLDDPRELRELVVPEGSPLAGDRIWRLDFPERYGAVVLGVVRGGRRLPNRDRVIVRPGDTLLIIGRAGFGETFADSRDFHLIGGAEVEPEGLADVPVWRPTKAKAGLAVLLGIVALAASGILHISLAALAGAITLVATGFVSPGEARRSVDWSVLIVIGSAIGLGTALSASGAAEIVGDGIVAVGRPLGPRGILAALLVGSMVLTLTITNNAAVAILFPVAVSVASDHGLDPRPYVVAVTVAASLAFATPVGYQTNLMVYGPGGYRFSDFVRAGMPLQILLALIAVVLIPLAWPLTP